MRVLITVLPDTGCLYSVLPVAGALAEAGHDVAFCSSASFGPSVEAHDHRHFPVGIDWRTSDPRYFQTMLERAGSSDLTRLTGTEPLAWVGWAKDFLCSYVAAAAVPDIVAVAREWEADVVVRDAVEFAGCVAAEALGLPHASITTTADSALDLGPLVAEQLDGLRAAAGLEPDGAMPYRYLHLSLVPPSFDGLEAPFPPTIRFVRYPGLARPGDRLPDGFEPEPDRPLALVNLGMVFHQVPGLFQEILDALAEETLDVVVATGSAEVARGLERVPANVTVVPWIPYGLVMPHCDVFVTHGGMSSMREALRFGVPLVVMPVFADQMYSAQRCEALELGPVLPPDRRSASNIAAATREAIADPRYRAAAGRIRADLDALPAIDHAVDLLERLVTQEAPAGRPSVSS